jgi:hypothetical protein
MGVCAYIQSVGDHRLCCECKPAAHAVAVLFARLDLDQIWIKSGLWLAMSCDCLSCHGSEKRRPACI